MNLPRTKIVDHAKAHSAALSRALNCTSPALVLDLCTKCHRYIEAGVPATDGPGILLRIFLRDRDWVESPDIVALFGAYVSAGYIDLAAPVLAVGTSAQLYPVGCHALEAAVIEGNAGAMMQMVAHGADPSRPTSEVILRNAPGAGSLIEFIAAAHSSPALQALVARMTALLIDDILRRQIASVSATKSNDLDLPIGPARHRRPGV